MVPNLRTVNFVILPQLQHIVCDEAPQECIEIFHQELKRDGAGGLCSTAHLRQHAEMTYQKRLEQILAEENCFKILIVSFKSMPKIPGLS